MLTASMYINYGRVIVDCPGGCNNSYRVEIDQPTAACTASDGCRSVFSVEYPENARELLAELERRPAPATRNWIPVGHRLTQYAGMVGGQTVADLRDEFEREA